MAVNAYLMLMAATHPGYFKAWDPYPFILLNLVLSFQAAYTGPVVMMSQNRQSEKDRLLAQHDFELNMKAEDEIKVILATLPPHTHLTPAPPTPPPPPPPAPPPPPPSAP